MEWPTHPTPGTPSHVPTSGGGGAGGSSDRASLRDGSGSSATTVPIPLLHGSSGTAGGSGARTGGSNGLRNGSGNGSGSTDSVRDSSGQVEYGRRQGGSTRPSLSEAGVHISGVDDAARAGDDSDDSDSSSSEAGVLTDNVPGVLAAAQVMRAVRMWRPSARKVAEEIQREEVAEAIGARPEKAARARAQVRDMMLYSVFVVLFTTVTLMSRNDSDLFFFTDALQKQLVTGTAGTSAPSFNSITTVADAYAWMEGPLVATLYSAVTFDGDDTYRSLHSNAIDRDGAPNFPGAIVGHGVVIGGIRVGQVRAMPRTCDIPPEFQGIDALPRAAWTCLAPEGEYSVPGAVGWPNTIANLTLQADADDEPDFASPVTGKEYAPPNVFTVLPNPSGGAAARLAALAVLRDMRNNSFVDLRTRALSVDINVYNPNLDYACLVRMVVELPDGGGVLPWARLATVRVYRDYLPSDRLRLGIEVLLMVMVVWYSYHELREWWDQGLMQYFQHFSVTHNANLVLFYVSAVYRVLAALALPTSFLVAGDAFVNLRTPESLLSVTEDVNAFNALLTWLKVFIYLNFVPRFQILLGTLSRAAGQVGVFSIICAVVLFGSSQAFTLLFGTTLAGYRNLTHSFFSLMSLLLGDFDFEALRYQQPILGPLAFAVFIMLAVFVLLNMFIALISDAFNEEKDRLALMEDFGVDTLGKHVAEALLEALERVPLMGRVVRFAEQRVAFYRFKILHNHHLKQLAMLADANQDNSVSPEEIAESLDKDANGEVTSSEVHDALIASGASSEAAHDIISKIPFTRKGVVSTATLAEMFRAAVSGANLADDGENDAASPQSPPAFAAAVPSASSATSDDSGGLPPVRRRRSPHGKPLGSGSVDMAMMMGPGSALAPSGGAAGGGVGSAGQAYLAGGALQTGKTTGTVSAFPFGSDDVDSRDRGDDRGGEAGIGTAWGSHKSLGTRHVDGTAGEGTGSGVAAAVSAAGARGAGGAPASGAGVGAGAGAGAGRRQSVGLPVDLALRAVNRLRIGIAGRKLASRDSQQAGLASEPVVSERTGALRPPPARPPPPRRPNGRHSRGSRAQPSPYRPAHRRRFGGRRGRRHPPPPLYLASPTDRITSRTAAGLAAAYGVGAIPHTQPPPRSHEVMMRAMNSRIAAMEQLLYSSVRQNAELINQLQRGSGSAGRERDSRSS